MRNYNWVTRTRNNQVLTAQIATTSLDTTNAILGAWTNCNGYTRAVILARTDANSSGTPDLFLDGGEIVGTTTMGAIYATLDADLTTTAGQTVVGIANLPSFIRTRLAPSTTTSAVRYRVNARLIV